MMVTKIDKVDLEKLRHTVCFPFDRKGGLKPPEELRSVGVGEEVKLLVTGKVTGLSIDEEGENLRLEVTAVDFAEASKRSLGNMLREIKKTKEA